MGEPAAHTRIAGFEPLQQEQMVIQYARTHGDITRQQVADLCRLSPDQATRLLRKLTDKHPELRLEGQRRGAHYVWHGPREGKRNKRK
jgi:ATP-dependent DNA helicase RecG